MGHFKGIVKFLRHLGSRILSRPTSGEDSQTSNRIPTPSSSSYELEPYLIYATDIYLSSYVRDSTLDPQLSEQPKPATVADLCSELGPQFPLQLVKLVAKDVLRALKDFHNGTDRSYGEINNENIMLSLTDFHALVSQLRADTQPSLKPSQLAIRYPFYQQSCPYSLNGDLTSTYALSLDTNVPVFNLRLPSNDEGLVDDYTTSDAIGHQALQPPEYLLGAPLGPSADMWTLGCILFELLAGEPLFDPVFQIAELDISREESHLIQMIELLGEIPKDLIRHGAGPKSGKWFTADGLLRIETTYYPVSLASILERHVEKSDLEGTTEFLEALLKLRPEDRPKPDDIIDHFWFSS